MRRVAIHGLQEKYGRNAAAHSVGVRYARTCVCKCPYNVSSCVLYAYVSFLSAFISILPANLSVSACVESARHFSVWVAGICLSALAFSLCFYVCLSAKLPVRSVCRMREAIFLSWRAPHRENWEAHLSQWVFVIASGVIRCPRGSALCSGRQGSYTALMSAV